MNNCYKTNRRIGTRFLSMILTVVIANWLTMNTGYGQINDSLGGSQWAVKMFSVMGTERVHDFGSVALHAEVEHRFVFRNIYKEDVEIQSAASNCGCTKVTVSKKLIRTGETGEIIARVDTSGKEHTKRRKATITVMFRSPQVAEVQLQIRTYIRADVGFEPGVVEFGTVAQGKGIKKKVYLQYEGNSGWALTSIRKTSSGVRAEAREIQRQGGRVTYEIDVELLPDAKTGYLNGLLRFTTNEANASAASIFLPLHGLIMEPLTAKPSCFQFGVIHTNQQVTKNLVVRGSTPFRILSVTSSDDRIRFLVANEESAVHVIPVTFIADEKTGDLNPTISIQTSEPIMGNLNVGVTGTVINSKMATPAPEKQTTLNKEIILPAFNKKQESAMSVTQPATDSRKRLVALALPEFLSSSKASDSKEENSLSDLSSVIPQKTNSVPVIPKQQKVVTGSKLEVEDFVVNDFALKPAEAQVIPQKTSEAKSKDIKSAGLKPFEIKIPKAKSEVVQVKKVTPIKEVEPVKVASVVNNNNGWNTVISHSQNEEIKKIDTNRQTVARPESQTTPSDLMFRQPGK